MTERKTTHGLRRRCPLCRKLRKFHEPHGNQGGESHERRMPWVRTPFGWACGFCVTARTGIQVPRGVYAWRDPYVACWSSPEGKLVVTVNGVEVTS